MPSTEIVMTPIQDVMVVNFRATSILESTAVQAVARDLYALVDQQACRKIVLDFSPVRMLSSQMIGVLINLHKKSQDIKGRVVLCGLRPDLSKIFKITNLDKVLTFADNEEQARAKFRAIG